MRIRYSAMALCLVCFCWARCTCNGSPGDQVVVVYNKNLAESKSVADYYAERRQIPKDHVWGLDLPTSEAISRSDYQDRLAGPLLKRLRESRLLVYNSGGHHRTNDYPIEARIRYATLCYGVPLKILNDPKVNEDGADKLRPELHRNDAAVDSELSLLPGLLPKLPVYGAVPNRFYGITNAALLNPTNGLLLVARLDGPSAAIARGLVDKAIEAENNGLWGRAYFDARGITNGTYRLGDEWIRGAAQVARKLGYETTLDNEEATFSASFPMSQIALYAGWYSGAVSGPFTRPTVEFMPGAFAYHLHSFSAQTIRSPTANWVGPLLAKGATATLGCVEEPYLEGTPDIATFLVRWMFFGFSFGEAAYACQSSLSWQTTVVGDPLYRPFAENALARHEQLIRRQSKLIEWSHLKAVDLNLAEGVAPEKLIDYLELTPDTYTSPVLLEKLGDLYFMKAKWDRAATNYSKALAHSPSPQQQVRLTLNLARTLNLTGKGAEEYALYQQFLKANQDYPDLVGIYRTLLPLAEQFGKPDEKQTYERELARLTSAGGASP